MYSCLKVEETCFEIPKSPEAIETNDNSSSIKTFPVTFIDTFRGQEKFYCLDTFHLLNYSEDILILIVWAVLTHFSISKTQ